jgi:hypothetical protein
LSPQRCEAVRHFWAEKLRNYVAVLEENPSGFDYLNEVKVLAGRIPLLDFDPTDAGGRPEVGGGRERGGRSLRTDG